jgi:hypothetical protein
MPHTHSRYMQDLGFSDGIINYAITDVVAIASAGGPATLVRNGPADLVYNVPNSTTETFSIPLFETLILRSGYPEDLQNVFGSTFGGGLSGPIAGPSGISGTGVPASAEPQGRPGSSSLQDGYILPGSPQPATGMGTLQEITPRTALKIKGIKPLAIAVKYKVITNPATALTCRIDKVLFANGVANTITNVLASGANGLTNVASANPYVIVVPIPNAVAYQIADLTEMWFELGVQTPAGGTVQFYGVRLLAEYNYN